jgi:2-hydroxycyclohexanecarboxyl-CoA dehydrogenase
MSKTRVVVVTGAASGIGLGIARLFAGSGHPVAMLDVSEQALEREGAELRGAGAKLLTCKVDVTVRSQVDAAYPYRATRDAAGHRRRL